GDAALSGRHSAAGRGQTGALGSLPPVRAELAMSALLEARNVTRIFGGGFLSKGRTLAVDDVSLLVNEDNPSITAIAGESGSGKTTLARLLLGVIQPTRGSILYRGRALTVMDGRSRKDFRREVQAIFQDPYEAYNPVYKVDQTLTTPV